MSRVFLVSAAVLLGFGGSRVEAARPQAATPDVVVTPDPTPPPAGAAAPAGQVSVTSSLPNPPLPRSRAGGPPRAQPAPRAGSTPASRTSSQAALAPPPAAAVREEPNAPDPAPLAGPPVLERAELCLRGEVGSAVRAEASAKLAADLLLEDLCGAEVDAASRYERNQMALARFNPVSERGRAGLSTARVDGETGEVLNPPGVDVASVLREANPELLSQRPSATLRRFAARLVLAERARVTAPPRRTR